MMHEYCAAYLYIASVIVITTLHEVTAREVVNCAMATGASLAVSSLPMLVLLKLPT